MVHEFKFPDVGEGITEGKLVKWLVKEGEQVQVDQSVAEIETDKAVVEIPSPASGTVAKLLFADGDMLEVGQVIMQIDDGSAGAPSEPAAPAQEAPKEEAPAEPAPDSSQAAEQPSAPQATPQPASAEQPAPQPEASPAPATNTPPTQTQSSPDGILAMPGVRKLAREKCIDLGSVQGSGPQGQILESDLGGGAPVQQAPTQSSPAPQESASVPQASAASPSAAATTSSAAAPINAEDINATPATRKLARELGVDIGTITGTGDNGKVTPEDVRNASQGGGSAPDSADIPPAPDSSQAAEQPSAPADSQPPPTQPAAPSPAPTPSADGLTETLPLTGLRTAIANKMCESMFNVPHVWVFQDIDCTELVALRDREKPKYEEQGVKLTYLAFFIKAIVLMLKKYPLMNANIDMVNKQIILKKYYNIGIAVESGEGVVAPVIKDADKKSIVDIAKEIVVLAGAAREKKLTPDQMNDGTFTITSLGNLGGTAFTAVINTPQVGIIGIPKMEQRAVVKDGEIVVRHMVTFSLAFDHRIMDGSTGAKFMSDLKAHLEDPEMMFMESS